MCTNFTPTKNKEWVKTTLGVELPIGFPAETYPGYLAPIAVRSHKTGRVACGLASFGLVPHWPKDSKISRHTYNARVETVSIKLSYRDPWKHRQFGLVLVDRFFDLGNLARASEGFSGSEIEQVVIDGMYRALGERENPDTDHMLKELSVTSPLSVVMHEKVAALRAWASGRTVPAD